LQVELKLKQASAVLGMPAKELQNLVQFGVVKPRRRCGLYVFDTVCLYQAQVAGRLRLALGSPTDKLAEFVEAFSEFVKRRDNDVPDVLVFRSSSKYRTCSVEIRLPFKDMRETLEARLMRVDLYRDLPRGRKRPKWKAEFLATLTEASRDIKDASPKDLQRAVREYRKSKKEKPEITVVAETAQVP
jgi:hypothetical protein